MTDSSADGFRRRINSHSIIGGGQAFNRDHTFFDRHFVGGIVSDAALAKLKQGNEFWIDGSRFQLEPEFVSLYFQRCEWFDSESGPVFLTPRFSLYQPLA